MYSVLILTKNEEVNLPGCLSSIPVDDVVVLDSFSTDRSRAIAAEAGARVFERAFDNYAAQRNFGINEIPYENKWLLLLDADERITSELHDEIMGALASAQPDVAMFRLRRKDFFLGRWIKRSSGYPTWFGRLIKVGQVVVERAVNEEYRTAGRSARLEHHLLHFPFNKGIGHWVDKHNAYSAMEAELLAAADSGAGDRSVRVSRLLSGDPVVKRAAQKQFLYRLPLVRPVVVFAYLYVFRLGVLDGAAGLYFCLLRSFYEVLIDLKRRELASHAD